MSNWEKYKETMQAKEQIHDLARAGRIEDIKNTSLDRQGINRKNGKGHSPLMLAAYNGHFELAEYLLEVGADANSIDLSGNSILMGVAFKGHSEIARLLLRHGADINYSNPKKQTALDFAQMFGRAAMVKLIKSKQNKPEVFSLLDILRGWSSILNLKRK